MAIGIAALGLKAMFGGNKPPQTGQKVQPPKPPAEPVQAKPKDDTPIGPTQAPKATKVKGPSSPLPNKTGIVPLDKSLKSISQSLGNIKGTLYSTKKFNKEKSDKVKKTSAKAKRVRREKKSESGGIFAGLLRGAKGSVKGAMDWMGNFLTNIIVGSLAVFLVKNINKVIQFVKDVRDKIEDVVEMIDKNLIQPVWKAAKAIVGPVYKIMKDIGVIPDYKGEGNELLKLANDLSLQIPIFGDYLKTIQDQVRKMKFDLDVKDTPTQTPPAQRPDYQGPSGTTTDTSESPSGTRPQTQRPGSAPSGGYETKLAEVLGDYEGLRLEAYPDANYGWEIPTIGIGATKYPPGFRLQGKVKKGDVITEEEAYMIKAHDIKEHRQRLLNELPVEIYNKLPDGVKAALESKVFNYGSLGGTLAKLVIDASKTGNFKPVADYFRNVLAKHNNGINSWRRNDEADMIMTGRSGRSGVEFGTRASVQPKNDPPSLRPGYSGKDAVVQYITGDRSFKSGSFGQDSFVDTAGHGGANYHEHISFKDRETAVRAYKFLTSKGITVTEFEGYGKYTQRGMRPGSHSAGGGHFGPVGGSPTYDNITDGTAFDIPLYPNITPGGSQDNKAGEERFSQNIRALLGEFLYKGETKTSTNAGQVSRTTSYEKQGTQTVIVPTTQTQRPRYQGGQRSSPTTVSGGGDNAYTYLKAWFKDKLYK